jgi:transglutaminase-like putative cysteine protease
MTDAVTANGSALRRRAVLALPVAIVAAVYGVVTDAWLIVVLVGALLAITCFVGARLMVGVALARVATLVTITLGFALSSALSTATTGAFRIASAWSGIAAASLLVSCLRLALKTPPGSYRVTAGVGLVAMVACGQTHTGGAYALAMAGYLLACLEALRVDDPARPSWGTAGVRAGGTAVVVLALVGALTATGAVAVPKFSEWVERKFELAYRPEAPRTGFTDDMGLGSMRGMLQSDELVLRVRGARVDYLRGVAYDRYYRGVWSLSRRREVVTVITAKTRAKGPGASEIERVGGDTDRIFLPFDARDVATVNGSLRSDAMGIARPGAGDKGDPLSFERGARNALVPMAPGDQDLALPPDLAPALVRVVAAWTAGAVSDADKLARIADRLEGGYAYSVEFTRTFGKDPVLSFLDDDKRGHCEYFASALALLGRAAGVPTRVVGGYRVAERNALGGYYVVRERNAHAWVEAWVDGVWKTFDATPAAVVANEGHDMGAVAAFADLLRAWWTAATDWTLARTPLELTLVATGLAILLLGYQRFRARTGRRRAATDDEDATRALPCLTVILEALAARGVQRPTYEALENFATRVDDPGAAALLQRYVALRYGGIGDPSALDREVREWARQTARG